VGVVVGLGNLWQKTLCGVLLLFGHTKYTLIIFKNQKRRYSMRTLELYYNDLTPKAQKKYLEVNGVSDASELNWEVSPIAIIEVEEEEPDLKNDMLKQLKGEPHLQ
jgi:hypothetical protein